MSLQFDGSFDRCPAVLCSLLAAADPSANSPNFGPTSDGLDARCGNVDSAGFSLRLDGGPLDAPDRADDGAEGGAGGGGEGGGEGGGSPANDDEMFADDNVLEATVAWLACDCEGGDGALSGVSNIEAGQARGGRSLPGDRVRDRWEIRRVRGPPRGGVR